MEMVEISEPFLRVDFVKKETRILLACTRFFSWMLENHWIC